MYPEGLAQVSPMSAHSTMETQIIAPPAWRQDLEDFARWQRSARKSPGTIKIRDYHLRRLATVLDIPPADVTLEQLVTYLAYPGAQWSAATQGSHRGTVQAFYRFLRVSGRISSNPAEFLPAVKQNPGLPRPASDSAVAEGLAAATTRVKLMIELGELCGLRCCEIAKVQSADLFRDNKGRWVLLVTGKGDKRRNVPVPNLALADEIRRAFGWLFPGDDEGHLSAAYVSRIISRALPAGVTAHTLRHRYATRALRATGNLMAVKTLLGHASIATTQIYTQVEDDELWEVAAAAA